MERIEWENSHMHRQIMADAGRSGSVADLFSADRGDFHSYLQRQQGSHTGGYEFDYTLLRAAAPAAPCGYQQSASSPQHYG